MPVPAVPGYPMPAESSLPANQVNWKPDPARAVLLVHDMQEYFLAPYERAASPCAELLANVRRLRESATAAGVPVVYSAQPGGMDCEQRGLLSDFWGAGMSKKDEHVRIVGELAPTAPDVVLTKWRYSAFVRSGLRELLADRGRDQLVVCGVYAHVGCLMTAVDAFSHDIEAFLVADAVADFSADYHRLALSYAAERCAVVTPAAHVADAFAGR